MHSSSEQLLPIVAGCRALVTAGYFAGCEVRVNEFVSPEYLQRHGLENASSLIGAWACQTRDRGLHVIACLPERILMRIDGYETKMRPEGVDRLIGMQMSVKINKRVQK